MHGQQHIKYQLVASLSPWRHGFAQSPVKVRNVEYEVVLTQDTLQVLGCALCASFHQCLIFIYHRRCIFLEKTSSLYNTLQSLSLSLSLHHKFLQQSIPTLCYVTTGNDLRHDDSFPDMTFAMSRSPNLV